MVEKPSEPPTSNRISLSLRPQCRSCLSTYLILLPITKTPSISQFYLMMRKKAPIDDNLLNRIVEEQLPENMEFWQNVTIAYQKASKEYWIRNVDDVKRHWVNIASSGSLDVLSEDAQFILLFCQVEQEQEKDVVSISIIEEETDLFYNIELKKQDIYKLIGALHLLHKEMK